MGFSFGDSADYKGQRNQGPGFDQGKVFNTMSTVCSIRKFRSQGKGESERNKPSSWWHAGKAALTLSPGGTEEEE